VARFEAGTPEYAEGVLTAGPGVRFLVCLLVKKGMRTVRPGACSFTATAFVFASLSYSL
jgi:hypothetical protein